MWAIMMWNIKDPYGSNAGQFGGLDIPALTECRTFFDEGEAM